MGMNVLIRADGSKDIGVGHIFRTLVLANELKSLGYDVQYLCRNLPGFPEKRIQQNGFKIKFIPDICSVDDETEFIKKFIRTNRKNWVVVDHYDIKEDYYYRLKELGLRTMAIDDTGHTKFPVSLLLNQNIGSTPGHYCCDARTVQLHGPQYAMLRDVYHQNRQKSSLRTSFKRLLIFMGGGSVEEQLVKILAAVTLSRLSIEIDVVTGGPIETTNRLKGAAAKCGCTCYIHHDIDHLADLMLEADVAICAGGSVCWELASMKIPMIIMPFADNQLRNAQELENQGAAINAGQYQSLSEEALASTLTMVTNEKIKSMSERVKEICDGKGVKRVAEILQSIN